MWEKTWHGRIINERVQQKNWIIKAQAGGQSGCATVDHISVLKQTFQKINDTGITAYIIFVDVQRSKSKALLNAIIYAFRENGVTKKQQKIENVNEINPNITTRIQLGIDSLEKSIYKMG